MKKSFTLLELLIAIGIFALLLAVSIALLDPLGLVQKSWDSKRKTDLQQMQKALEDWYNDKGCYPKPEEICVNTAQYPIENVCNKTGSTKYVFSRICKICGKLTPSSPVSKYLPGGLLPCDPEWPNKFYLYQVDTPNATYCSTGLSCQANTCPATFCPQKYTIYTDLGSVNNGRGTDSDSVSSGCIGGGCGIDSDYAPAPTIPFGFDYGVSNSSVPVSDEFACYTASRTCDACGTYGTCKTNAVCFDKDKIYSTGTLCRQKNGL